MMLHNSNLTSQYLADTKVQRSSNNARAMRPWFDSSSNLMKFFMLDNVRRVVMADVSSTWVKVIFINPHFVKKGLNNSNMFRNQNTSFNIRAIKF